MGDGHFSRGSATPPSQGGRAPELPSSGTFFNAYFLGCRTTKFDMVKGGRVFSGEAACFQGTGTPHPNGSGAPVIPNFWVLSIYAYTLCGRSTKFDTVYVAPTPGGRDRNPPQFWGSLI